MLNIAFIGSGGDFSLQPLKYLLNSEHHLCAVGVDGISKTLNTDPRLQIFQPQQVESVESLARNHHIPIVDLQQDLSELCDQLVDLKLDLIFVACYSKKLPLEILNIPKIAVLNLHPSLLPAYRGPVPLFWQFRQGKNEYGISLHKMDASFDTGPIIAQQTAIFRDGLTHHQANSILAEHGTQLVINYLAALLSEQVTEQIQVETIANYQSYPQQADFRISNCWTAQRLFNFIRASKHWGQLYPCDINGETFTLQDVISYTPETPASSLESDLAYEIQQDIILIRCQTGMLKARLFNPINDRIPS